MWHIAMLIPEAINNTEKYAKNRVGLSHQPTRVRERGMRWSDGSEFKSVKHAQRFLNTHAAIYNLFNFGRHSVSAEIYRHFRLSSFASWKNAFVDLFAKFFSLRQNPVECLASIFSL